MGLGICLDIQFLGDADGADPGQHLENHVPKVIEVFRSKDSPLYRLFGIVLVSNPTLNLPHQTTVQLLPEIGPHGKALMHFDQLCWAGS